MARLELNYLEDDSRIWVFGISPPLGEREAALVLERVDGFLAEWSAHGAPVAAGRELREGSFLVIAVDRRSETSGCSIDRMFGLLRRFEQELEVSVLDPDRIFVRGGDGRVHAMSRTAFREAGDEHTIVFDLLVSRLGEIRRGTWERPAKDSWHARLLPKDSTETGPSAELL